MIRTPHRYYALVASLPALPRIRQAERLPINEQRLESRLRMLRPEDAEVIAQLRRFIQWQNWTPDQTDADVAEQYRELLAKNPHPAVRDAIEFRIGLRTVLAALRRRRRGETEAPSDPAWGLGRWVRNIEANWSHPDFKLAHVFPWIPQMREHLEREEALQLEELAMNLVWDALDRTTAGKYFQLENVIAFVFKWDVLGRWLSYSEETAKTRFESLAATLFAPNTDSPQKASS